MLFDQINKDHIAAFKARDKETKEVLSSIISKCKYKKVEKGGTGEISDEDVLKIIEKTVKELDEEIQSFAAAGEAYKDRVATLTKQKEVIKAYLPAKLSAEEIKNLIANLEDKSLPNVMKYFKANYAGKCDMALVSQLAKEINK